MLSNGDRVQKLILLVRRFKLEMLSQELSYSDKVALLTFIAGSYVKILHQYKIDDILYKQAHDELASAIAGMRDEISIDAAFQLTLHYLELLTKALRKWL